MKSVVLVIAVAVATVLTSGANAQVPSIQFKEESKALLEQAKELERQASVLDRQRPKGTVDPEVVRLRSEAKLLRDEARYVSQMGSQTNRHSNYYRPNGYYPHGHRGANLGNVRTQVWTNGNGGNVRFSVPGAGNVTFGSNGFRFNANNLNGLFR